MNILRQIFLVSVKRNRPLGHELVNSAHEPGTLCQPWPFYELIIVL